MTTQQDINAIRKRFLNPTLEKTCQDVRDMGDLLMYIDQQQAEIVRLRAALKAWKKAKLAIALQDYGGWIKDKDGHIVEEATLIADLYDFERDLLDALVTNRNEAI